MHTIAKYRWLFVPLILALAALACDSVYYDPLHVQGVQADLDTPGHAFAWVGNEETASVYYETDDYGQNWHPPGQRVTGENVPNSIQLRMNHNETLLMGNIPLWTFPRQTFRFFFLNDEYGKRFNLPVLNGIIEGSAAGDTLYVPMGTEGVLVGPMPGTNSSRQWVLTSNGIDRLDPLPLTITDPATVAVIVLLALAVPPLALIHAYLLSRVWVYLVPPQTARRYVLITSFALAGLAAAAVVIWLTNISVTYIGIVAGMGLIVLAVDEGITLWLLRQQRIQRKVRLSLIVGAGVLSIIVPAGVAAIWWLWWLIFALVFCFAMFQWLFHDRLLRPVPEAPTRRQRWLVDRLTVEIVIIVSLGAALTAFLGIRGSNNTGIVIALLLAISSPFALNRYTLERLRMMPELSHTNEENPFPGMIFATLVIWAVAVGAASLATFFLQMQAYGWFTSLFK